MSKQIQNVSKSHARGFKIYTNRILGMGKSVTEHTPDGNAYGLVAELS